MTGLRVARDHRQRHVLDRDVLILQPVGLLLGGIQDTSERLGDVHLTLGGAGSADARSSGQVLIEFVAKRLDVHIEPREQVWQERVALIE
jgi:hypothetical protein